MKQHFNLYYLFLEDKLKNPMPPQRVQQIRQILEGFFRAIRGNGQGKNLLREKS